MYLRKNENGSAHAVVVVCLVLALVTALGWIFYQNFIHKEDAKKETELVVVDKEDKQAAGSETAQYKDFRKDKKDATGIRIESVADVEKLAPLGNDLKKYFEDNVGNEVPDTFHTVKGKQYFIVDRVYGNYAAGNTNAESVYAIWGPSNEKIDRVAGTQNKGFSCQDLKIAKVPAELVDGKCMSGEDNFKIVDYKS